MRKKLTAGVLVASMAVSLMGCGTGGGVADGSVTSGSRAEEGGKTEIRFAWWGDTKRNEVYNQICDLFEEQNPDISVVREPVSWSDYWTKLATQVGGGNAPDVFGMHPQYASDYALRGAMLDLQPYVDDGTIDTSKMADSVVESGKYQDTLYMISQGISFNCYLVNNELAEEYGVTLPGPTEDWTWKEFKSEAEKFAQKAEGQDLYFAGDSSGAWVAFRWAAREAGGDQFTEDGKLDFTEDTLVEWLDFWDEMREIKAVPDAATSTEDGTATTEQKVFTQGKQVLFNVPINQLYLYQNAMPDHNISAVRIPVGENGERAEYIEGAYFGVSSKIDEAHQKAAVKLIDFFVNSKEAAEIFQMEQGVPANQEMAEFIKPLLDEANTKSIDFTLALMEVCKPAVYAPKGASEIDTAYQTAAQTVSFGQADSETAAKSFMEEANSILERNG